MSTALVASTERRRYEDLRGLGVSLVAVATSGVMPRWREYVSRVRAQADPRKNDCAPHHRAGLRAVLARHRVEDRRLRADPLRLLTALVSFVDDHDHPPPDEVLPAQVALRIVDALDASGPLTIDEQLELALGSSASLAEAILALHLATRVLARGRDTRLHRSFALSLEERLRIGRAIAPFDPIDARGGDPLGDTYHYWANVAAGLFVATHPGSPGAAMVAAAMFSGPWLMSGVREHAFGNVLFFGNHARIDRIGLRDGLWLARASIEP